MTDPSAGALERARLITDLLIADPPNKDNRGDVEEWICRELDAVQQPLREQVGYWKHQADRWQVIANEKAEACVALRARVVELEKALDRAEALGQSHYQGMHTAKAEVEALRRERDNALDAANHMQQTLALYSVHDDGCSVDAPCRRCRAIASTMPVGNAHGRRIEKMAEERDAALNAYSEAEAEVEALRRERDEEKAGTWSRIELTVRAEKAEKAVAALQNERERLREALGCLVEAAESLVERLQEKEPHEVDYDAVVRFVKVARAALAPLEGDVRPATVEFTGRGKPRTVPEAPLEGSSE